MSLVLSVFLQLAYIQACFEVELETAEKQMQAEQLATRERIGQEIKDKILQLQEEIVATELNEGKNNIDKFRYPVLI